MNREKDDDDDDEEDDKEVDTSAEERGTEVQYLIKWLGYSHLHNTWETGRILYISIMILKWLD